MKTQTIYLVRHAETTLNGTYCGSLNPALNANGEKQIKKLAEALREVPFDLCVHSPLTRTQQTADEICKVRKIPILSVSELREISFGDWEGKNFEEVKKSWPELHGQWLKNPLRTQIPNAEPFRDFMRRVKKIALQLPKLKEKNILVVAHGVVLAILLIQLLEKEVKDLSEWAPPLASITELKKYGNGKGRKFKIARLKDTAHLKS